MDVSLFHLQYCIIRSTISSMHFPQGGDEAVDQDEGDNSERKQAYILGHLDKWPQASIMAFGSLSPGSEGARRDLPFVIVSAIRDIILTEVTRELDVLRLEVEVLIWRVRDAVLEVRHLGDRRHDDRVLTHKCAQLLSLLYNLDLVGW
jgi:hypothetical protein